MKTFDARPLKNRGLQKRLANSGQRQRRIRAGSDDQMQLLRQIFEQKSNQFMDWPGLDQMIIIQNKRKVCRNTAYIMKQVYQNGFDRWRLR